MRIDCSIKPFVYDSIKNRGITRLCYFTPLTNLKHIMLNEYGIITSKFIPEAEKNVNDLGRWDGKHDHVCCNIQYPNLLLYESFKKNSVDNWALIHIKPECLAYKDTMYCPVNGAEEKGRRISDSEEGYRTLFETEVCHKHGTEIRNAKIPDNMTTYIQAEVLVDKHISVSDFIEIVFDNEDILDEFHDWLEKNEIKYPPLCLDENVFSRERYYDLRNGIDTDVDIMIKYNGRENYG